jgi:hypothetical protein
VIEDEIYGPPVKPLDAMLLDAMPPRIFGWNSTTPFSAHSYRSATIGSIFIARRAGM